ncbi:unnamed protein product [Cylicocyclus nassatus]|uniref:Mediator of RNA polymerase II transcription subunit 23 n=1 Tax=Cylicocyclus nassatus TaxID=53992 RepID=A0AA36HC29_CYLNA|nr:unnamed protein product [Cylicocyclus nassatus]
MVQLHQLRKVPVTGRVITMNSMQAPQQLISVPTRMVSNGTPMSDADAAVPLDKRERNWNYLRFKRLNFSISHQIPLFDNWGIIREPDSDQSSLTQSFINDNHQRVYSFEELIYELADRIITCSEFILTPPSYVAPDWRFAEYPPAAQALYLACIELLASPHTLEHIVPAMISLLVRSRAQPPRPYLMLNAIALLLTALPDAYCRVLQNEFLNVTAEYYQMLQPPTHCECCGAGLLREYLALGMDEKGKAETASGGTDSSDTAGDAPAALHRGDSVDDPSPPPVSDATKSLESIFVREALAFRARGGGCGKPLVYYMDGFTIEAGVLNEWLSYCKQEITSNYNLRFKILVRLRSAALTSSTSDCHDKTSHYDGYSIYTLFQT